MRSDAWREFLIGVSCGVLFGLSWLLPRHYATPYLWPLLGGAFVLYLARSGYAPWRRDNIRVARGECHVITVRLMANMSALR